MRRIDRLYISLIKLNISIRLISGIIITDELPLICVIEIYVFNLSKAFCRTWNSD